MDLNLDKIMIQENDKTDLYMVQNGVGKCVLFSNMIEDLYKKQDKKISVASSYPELFSTHPLVANSLPFHISNKDIIQQYFENIIYFEPYHSSYIRGDEHILTSWRKGYVLEAETYEDYTMIYTNAAATAYYKEVKKALNNKPYIILQLKGGTSTGQVEERNDLYKFRSYKNEFPLVAALQEEFKDYFFMVIKTAADKYDEKIDKLERMCSVEDESLLIIQELVNKSKTFVGIDSCVQHMACNKQHGKNGVVLWNHLTEPNLIGHDRHTNIISDTIEYVDVKIDDVNTALKNILSTNAS